MKRKQVAFSTAKMRHNSSHVRNYYTIGINNDENWLEGFGDFLYCLVANNYLTYYWTKCMPHCILNKINRRSLKNIKSTMKNTNGMMGTIIENFLDWSPSTTILP
jgi:hypothetical protein